MPLLSWIEPSEFHKREGEDLRVRIAGPIETDALKTKLDELQVRVTLLNESLSESFGTMAAAGSPPSAE